VGVVGVVVVVGGGAGEVKCPTKIVTVLPFVAEPPGDGNWSTTLPS
jgi:hypothetical protein